MFRLPTLTIFALAAGLVVAQTPSVTPSAVPSGTPDACVLTCSTTAATTAGCASFADLTCVCNSAQFQQLAGECIQTTCPDQLAAAQALQQASCAGVSPPIVSSVAPSGTSESEAPSGTGSVSSAPGTSAPGTSAPGTSRPATSVASGTPSASVSASASRSSAPASTTGAAFKNAPVAGAMGALAAIVGAAIF